MSATQKLRDMIDDLRWGGVKFSDLAGELDRIETELGLPVTVPSDDKPA